MGRLLMSDKAVGHERDGLVISGVHILRYMNVSIGICGAGMRQDA
jgi:hypothetical protein